MACMCDRLCRGARRASNTCVPGSDPVEMVAPGTRVPGCPTILEQTLVQCHAPGADVAVDVGGS